MIAGQAGSSLVHGAVQVERAYLQALRVGSGRRDSPLIGFSADALAACDQAARFRRIVKCVARHHGMEATFLAWLDLRGYGLSHVEIETRLRKHKVALTSGRFFGHIAGEGFMRVNYGCPRAQLEEGLKRLTAAINEG